MYYMAQSYYLNMSWGQRTILKGLSGFINPESRAKMQFTGDGTMPGLQALFHPGQLEKRFGGGVDTPTNFWPPYIGKHFIPEGEKPSWHFMEEEEYKTALRENPELYQHPDFMTSPDCPSRDFKFVEQYTPTDVKDSESHATFLSANTHEPGSHKPGFMSSMRNGSLFLDAYTGDVEVDYDTKLINQQKV
jgi:hypothetical protein